MNDLAFADDIALLESSSERAQKQLDALRICASTLGLVIMINVLKTEQMRLNAFKSFTPRPPLNIDGQPIEVVNEFKYLGSYMGSTYKDIHTKKKRLTWAAVGKLKPILASRSGMQTVKLKMRLFTATCLSILLYGCERSVLTAQQVAKLDIFARTFYCIVLGIRQLETHTTNEQLYRLANARPISPIILHSLSGVAPAEHRSKCSSHFFFKNALLLDINCICVCIICICLCTALHYTVLYCTV